MGTRAIWKSVFGPETDFSFSFNQLTRRTLGMMFGRIGPILIGCGFVSIVPFIVTQPILDLTGEVGSYIESCPSEGHFIPMTCPSETFQENRCC
jgi:hypothetical protein